MRIYYCETTIGISFCFSSIIFIFYHILNLTKMKNYLFLFIVYSLFVTPNLCAQNLSTNEVFDVLSKWEGNWRSIVLFEESVWIEESFETRGISESNLILSNNYLEMNVYNGNETSKHIIRYDQNSKQFNRWEFKSDGGTNFWVGKWSQIKETMTWTYVDFTNTEIRGEIIETFSSNNTINVNVAMKDKKGNNLLRISSKANKI